MILVIIFAILFACMILVTDYEDRKKGIKKKKHNGVLLLGAAVFGAFKGFIDYVNKKY